MNFLNREIRHPVIAFFVIFFITVVISLYGLIDGSVMIFDLLAGVLIYKLLIPRD